MKILQVIDQLDTGGGEKVFVMMCNLLRENGSDVSVLFLREPGKLYSQIDEMIPCFALQRHNKWSWEKMKACANVLKEYDIIHCHFKHVFKYVSLINFVFRFKKKIILHDHGHGDESIKNLLFRYLFKPIGYVGVNHKQIQWAQKVLHLNMERIFLLENTIVPTTDKKHLNSSDDIVLVSNIKPTKNAIFAARLMERLNRTLTLIGDIQDNKYYEEICTYNGFINHYDGIIEIQPYLHQFKLGLHVSPSETGPLVLLEYLAQGLPFLAYDTGEVAKALKPHFPIFFITSFDEDEWIKRISLLLHRPPKQAEMLDVFNQLYGQERYLQQLIAIYKCVQDS